MCWPRASLELNYPFWMGDRRVGTWWTCEVIPGATNETHGRAGVISGTVDPQSDYADRAFPCCHSYPQFGTLKRSRRCGMFLMVSGFGVSSGASSSKTL